MFLKPSTQFTTARPWPRRPPHSTDMDLKGSRCHGRRQAHRYRLVQAAVEQCTVEALKEPWNMIHMPEVPCTVMEPKSMLLHTQGVV